MATERDILLYEYLVLRFRRGDQAAAGKLTDMFNPSLHYFVNRLVDSEADAWDILQETWMSVFRALRQATGLREPRALPAFVYRVARNAAWAHLRRKRVEVSRDDDVPEVAAEDTTIPTERAELIHHALGRLTVPQREVVTLFFLQDLSIDEIADVMCVPTGTVKSRLHHAKRALRTILQEEDRRD